VGVSRGSALAGESSPEAAARELLEETGLRVLADELVFVGRYVETSALVDLYVARIAEPPTLVVAPDEVAAAEWITLADMGRRLDGASLAAPWRARLTKLWPTLQGVVQAGSDGLHAH
jgi:8-oxo-dGTP diphosphatase